MTFFLDTSVVLRVAFGENNPLPQWSELVKPLGLASPLYRVLAGRGERPAWRPSERRAGRISP